MCAHTHVCVSVCLCCMEIYISTHVHTSMYTNALHLREAEELGSHTRGGSHRHGAALKLGHAVLCVQACVSFSLSLPGWVCMYLCMHVHPPGAPNQTCSVSLPRMFVCYCYSDFAHLEHGGRGVHDAGVDVAELPKPKEFSAVRRVIELVGSGHVNRRGARAATTDASPAPPDVVHRLHEHVVRSAGALCEGWRLGAEELQKDYNLRLVASVELRSRKPDAEGLVILQHVQRGRREEGRGRV
jgi:hypothetical protein